MNVSGNELIGTIYSYLLEEFGFGYIDKDLWMIAENLSEKIANEQPQLNENQQIVLEWLKKNYFDSYFKAVISNLFFFIRHDDIDGFPNETSHKMVEAYGQLSNKEFAKVLEVFSRWALEQEEE